jgi:hypothetical protein
VAFPDRANAFEILSAKKSFVVLAETAAEKQLWLDKLKQYANLAAQEEAKNGRAMQAVDWAPAWNPDSSTEFCAVCQMVKFSTFTRRVGWGRRARAALLTRRRPCARHAGGLGGGGGGVPASLPALRSRRVRRLLRARDRGAWPVHAKARARLR